MKWYSILKNKNRNKMFCLNCEKEIDVFPSLDHHNCICINCEITCMIIRWFEDVTIQLIPSRAPDGMKSFLEWTQMLDELEFFELLYGLDDFFSDYYKTIKTKKIKPIRSSPTPKE